MKLVVISHTVHHRNGGGVVGWAPTLREIDHLASLFDDVVHIAPLHGGPPPPNSVAPAAANVRYRAISAAGGNTVWDKLKICTRVIEWARVISEEVRSADVVHVRCPAAVSLVALVMVPLMKPEARQWVKYAGTWEATGDEPLSYRIQRWWLGHRFQHGTVTVNGSWPDQPAHVISMHNPCLTVQELTSARSEALQKTLSTPLRIVFVGRLTEDKGIGRTLRIVRNLREAGIPVHLDVAGDDPARLSRESESRGLGLAGCVTFHGWASRSELTSIYRDAHIILLPSRTEGWPKVLSEAMAFGVVPVASAVGSVPQILGEINAGVALPYADERGMVVAIEQYWNAPSRWAMHSQIVTRAAMKFTYETYLRRVAQILDLKNRLDTQLQVASGG